jgi:hypothetical protein
MGQWKFLPALLRQTAGTSWNFLGQPPNTRINVAPCTPFDIDPRPLDGNLPSSSTLQLMDG